MHITSADLGKDLSEKQEELLMYCRQLDFSNLLISQVIVIKSEDRDFFFV